MFDEAEKLHDVLCPLEGGDALIMAAAGFIDPEIHPEHQKHV